MMLLGIAVILAGIALSISNIFAFVGGAAGLLITIAGMLVRGKKHNREIIHEGLTNDLHNRDHFYFSGMVRWTICRRKHRFWRPTRVFSSQSAVSCFSYGNLYSKGN